MIPTLTLPASLAVTTSLSTSLLVLSEITPSSENNS